MKIFEISDMTGGWFIGDFEPCVLKTKGFEVGYKIHSAGEKWDRHLHKKITEYNLLISGNMLICDKIVTSGQIFVIDKNEIADPVFETECHIICVKVPSVIGDKYVVN